MVQCKSVFSYPGWAWRCVHRASIPILESVLHCTPLLLLRLLLLPPPPQPLPSTLPHRCCCHRHCRCHSPRLRGQGGGVGRGVSGGRAGSRLGGRDAAGGGGGRAFEWGLGRLHGGTGCERERERGFDFPGEGSSEV